jgi:hypothetical protein
MNKRKQAEQKTQFSIRRSRQLYCAYSTETSLSKLQPDLFFSSA